MKLMNERQKKCAELCDGKRTSKEIASMLCDNAKYVQWVMKKFDLPRLPQAPRTGENNPSFVSGRTVDRDGYVLTSAPLGHPQARMRKSRSYGRIYEHRLLMEGKIGRFLLPSEVVDHIDGLRLHNSVENLRLFSSNAEHLKNTITGQIPSWSKEGIEKQFLPQGQRKGLPQINTYHKMKVSGDARLRQILLAALQLGINSPFLLGTHRHLKKIGIFDYSDSNLKHELIELYRRYE